MVVSNKHLRGYDCKYRESVDRLKKSKTLITCQKNTFGELSSKILFNRDRARGGLRGL